MSKINKKRKVTYYIGLGMVIVGFLLFISVFFHITNVINRSAIYDPTMGFRFTPPPFQNAVIGMILMISGAIVASIGAKGAAGSGLLLDPDQAREDLKPFNEATGKMINDVVSNIDAVENLGKPQENKEIIKIKCRSCGSLNDEDAKFCKNCGDTL